MTTTITSPIAADLLYPGHLARELLFACGFAPRKSHVAGASAGAAGAVAWIRSTYPHAAGQRGGRDMRDGAQNLEVLTDLGQLVLDYYLASGIVEYACIKRASVSAEFRAFAKSLGFEIVKFGNGWLRADSAKGQP